MPYSPAGSAFSSKGSLASARLVEPLLMRVAASQPLLSGSKRPRRRLAGPSQTADARQARPQRPFGRLPTLASRSCREPGRHNRIVELPTRPRLARLREQRMPVHPSLSRDLFVADRYRIPRGGLILQVCDGRRSVRAGWSRPAVQRALQQEHLQQPWI
jgi:hypothetical protein